MYQQQSGVGGGMLKRHFTMIYNQLDELREQMARVESNIADLALRMQEINRQYTTLEGSRNQISNTERTSQELTSAVDSLKRDINSLRARFESELLSIGDPINSREKASFAAPTPTPTVSPPPIFSPPPIQAPQSQPEPEPETPKPTEIPTPQPEETPAQATPAPAEEAEQPKEQTEPESGSDKTYSPSVKSLEEQLGLVPPSEDENKESDEKQSKPEEKKKRRFF